MSRDHYCERKTLWSTLVLAILSLVLMCIPHATAWAETEMLSERPSFGGSPVSVAPGEIQIESGFTYERSKVRLWDALSVVDSIVLAGLGSSGEFSVFGYPELLVRVGLLPGVEARLGFPEQMWTWPKEESFGDATLDKGDLLVGLKIEIVPKEFPIAAALIPVVGFSQAEPFPKVPVVVFFNDTMGVARADTIAFIEDSQDPVPEVVLAWSRPMENGWSLGGMLGYAWRENARGDDDIFFPTVALGIPIGDRGGTFIEWSAEYGQSDAAHLLHHGYTLSLNDDLRLDVHGGFGLTDAAPDFFVGTGFSWRFKIPGL